MSYRDLSTPLPGYAWPLARLSRAYRGNRPLSDGDLWAACLPPVTSTPRRSITDHSCLKVYHKDPAQAFSHGGRPANGDARVSEPAPERRTVSTSVEERKTKRYWRINSVENLNNMMRD